MDICEDKVKLTKVVQALKKLVHKQKKREDFKKLFADEVDQRQKVNLVVTLSKLPPIPEDGKIVPFTIRSKLPHSFVDELTDVLLVTRNVKGYESKRSDYMHSTMCFKDLLREHDALNLVTEVMSFNQLEIENRDFECKRNLASRFDMVLCDAAVIDEIAPHLGKPFYNKKKRPIQIDLKAENVKNKILNALAKSYLHMNLDGTCSMVQIGRLNQRDTHLAENIMATIENVKEKVPGGWANVKCIHLKTNYSRSFPLYFNSETPNHILPVEHPNKKEDVILAEDQLSTVNENNVVRVYASGSVLVLPKNERRKVKGLEKLKEKREEYRTRYDPATDKIIVGLGDKITKAKLRAQNSRIMPYRDFKK